MKIRKALQAAAVIMATALAGCSAAPQPAATAEPTAEASGIYTPGTYTAVSAGRNADIKVEVTFSADAIEDVKITEHSETDGIGTNATDTIPGKIVETQSLGIDAVAGATMVRSAKF